MTAGARVIGTTELLARFVKGAALGEVAATVGAETLAADIAASARNLAPFDTGHLHDSISAERNVVTATASYAAYVEFGASDRPAQPFFRPAIDGQDHNHAVQTSTTVLKEI